MKEQMVSEKRKYAVINTKQAKEISKEYLLSRLESTEHIHFGLPEINDRYHTWNVPISYNHNSVGEISIDAYSGLINENLSSNIDVIVARIRKVDSGAYKKEVGIKLRKNKESAARHEYKISSLGNQVILGKAELALTKLPSESIDLVFTSPPYYNARKEYSEYDTYEDYLDLMRKVIVECKRVLIDGKFFVINSSHVLIPRATRSEASRRIAVPFDLHQIFMEEGFEFVDDIIWQKPEGAGWASGRGRRFSADRNPMQYKAVPVTEYVMVYRKNPCVLIDHFIRNHPNQDLISASKIEDGYEKTNVWYISPARDKRHPAVFPTALVEKVIKYYSFQNDVVLDPFGGVGTTAKVAASLTRRFCSIELSEEYVQATLMDLRAYENNFINGFTFEYLDWSKLSPPEDEPRSLHAILRHLRMSGVSEDRIIAILNELDERKFIK